ncbi:hypothetical protein GF376_00010 [Candidatus Peregrinibacteria bacterium]|nr:hypothetical protein [Candidatus Peregrinibacteria bacterium]
MKKLFTSIIAASLLMTSTAFAVTEETFKDFDDVPTNHPNYDAILLLRYQDVLEGYEDNTFRPETPINRVEALKLVFEVSDMNPEQGIASAEFSDTQKDAWYAPYLNKAVYKEIVAGYPDGSFKPAQNVNLVEFLKMLTLAQNVDFEGTRQSQTPYTDVIPGSWYTKYIDYAKTYELIDADSENKIYPAEPITRAMAAEIIFRFKNIDKKIDQGDSENEIDSESESTLDEETKTEIDEGDYALFVSQSYRFAIKYPKYWFFRGQTSENDGVIAEYLFGPDDLSENEALVMMELLPLNTEVENNDSYFGVEFEREENENGIALTRKIEENRVYKIIGPKSQEANMKYMISSLTNQVEGLESYNPEEVDTSETENSTDSESTENTSNSTEEGQADTSDPDAI